MVKKSRLIKIYRVCLLTAIVLTLSLFVFLSPVSAAVEQATQQENYMTGGDGDSDKIYAASMVAMQFTTSESHTITKVGLPLKKAGTVSTLTISIREASSDVPTGVDLVSTTYNANLFTTSYAWYYFDLDETSLESGVQYAIVLKLSGGDTSNYVYWQKDTGGGEADAVASHSTDGGANWTSDTPEDNLFDVWGKDCLAIKSVGVFTDYYETGDMMFVIECKNIVAPYSTTVNPQRYFQFQLLHTDGTTLLASTEQKMWGYRPASIYLSAESAASISYGGAYHIAATGINGVSDSDDYTLTAANWMGDEITQLDEYVRVIATNMEDYDSEEYLTWSDNDGLVLNSTAASIFIYGVSALPEVRPELFGEGALGKIYITQTDASDSFDTSGDDWETNIGTYFGSLGDYAGGLIGVDGQQMWSFAIIGLMMLVGGIGLGGIGKGDGLTSILLTVPIAFAGAYAHIFAVQWLLLPAGILAFWFAKKIWLG